MKVIVRYLRYVYHDMEIIKKFKIRVPKYENDFISKYGRLVVIKVIRCNINQFK